MCLDLLRQLVNGRHQQWIVRLSTYKQYTHIIHSNTSIHGVELKYLIVLVLISVLVSKHAPFNMCENGQDIPVLCDVGTCIRTCRCRLQVLKIQLHNVVNNILQLTHCSTDL